MSFVNQLFKRMKKSRLQNYVCVQVCISLLLICVCCAGKSEKHMKEENDVGEVEETTGDVKLDEKGVEIIDLGSNYKLSNEPFPMSEIVDASDVQYIKLETTDDALLPLLGQMKVVDDQIFLTEPYAFKYVYQFNKNGKFINRIGKIGQGPGEYKLAMGFTVDDTSVYLPIIDANYMYVYDRNGNYEGKIEGCLYTQSLTSRNDKLILARGQHCYNQDIFSFLIFDKTGKLEYKHKPEVSNGLINQNRWSFSYQTTPITQTKEHILLFEIVDNYIYEVTDQLHRPYYKIDMGAYAMPLKYISKTSVDKKDYFRYFSLIGLFETSNDILFRIGCGYEFSDNCIARFNKQSKKVQFWKQPEYLGEKQNDILYNDIDGGPSYVIRNNLDDPNYLYVLIYPHMVEKYLEKWRDKMVKYPEKRAELCKLLSQMQEEDNPILVLYKKK